MLESMKIVKLTQQVYLSWFVFDSLPYIIKT